VSKHLVEHVVVVNARDWHGFEDLFPEGVISRREMISRTSRTGKVSNF
jgi:hypothetical protein